MRVSGEGGGGCNRFPVFSLSTWERLILQISERQYRGLQSAAQVGGCLRARNQSPWQGKRVGFVYAKFGFRSCYSKLDISCGKRGSALTWPGVI